MKFEININDVAEVVLTAYGAQVYNEYHEQFKHYRPELKVGGDVLRDQLWSMMQVFGRAIYLGGQTPFENCKMIFEKGER